MKPKTTIDDLSRGYLTFKWEYGIIRRFLALGMGLVSLDMVKIGNPNLR
jgi:hypothetical protein